MSDNATPETTTENELYESIKTAIKEEVKAEVRADLKKELSRKPAYVPAQPKEDDWDLNEYIKAIGNTTARDGRREKALNLLANKYGQKDMTQGTDAAGGFLVPEIWHQELFSVGDMGLALYPRVRKVPMQTDTLRIPVLDQTVTPSSGSNAFNAGVSVAAVSEANAPAGETAPAFKQLTLNAIKFLTSTQVSRELLENSTPSVAAIVAQGLPKSLADYIEYQIINGSSLTGIVGHAATIKVPRDTANRIKLEDLAKMYGKFTGSNPVFVVNKSATEQLFQLEDASGRNVWLPNQNINGTSGASIFGVPLVFSQYNPVLGAEGDVMLVDASAYILGENKGVSIEASEHYAFPSELITYRMSWRGMGKPMITAPIKLADGTLTVSPFVVLDDATS